MEKKNDIGQADTKPHDKKASAENLMIPKHRFDCVNLCLKETKELLHQKMQEAVWAKTRMDGLEKALLDSKVETALALHKAKNLTSVKALIDFSELKLGQDGTVPGLEEQILRIKKSQNYLFESQEELTYVLVPVKSGEPLNKSIANYFKKDRRTEI